MKTLTPIDTSVKIPAAVVQAAARAEAAMKAQFAAPVNGEADPATQTPTPEAAPVAEGTPAPAPVAPQPVTVEATPAPPQPAPATPEGTTNLQRDLDAALGRLRSEQAKNTQLSDRVASMERMLASMATAPEPVTPTTPVERFSTTEDEETWGPELLSAVERKARDLIEPMRREMEARLGQVTNTVKEVKEVETKNAHQTMRAYLDTNTPDWLQINVDPEFARGWVLENDPLTGLQRLSMMRNAWDLNDGPRVAAFFQQFLREKDASAPPAPTPAAATPAVTLGAFAAPGRAKSAAPTNGPADKPSFTNKEIAAFYVDCQKGKFRNNQAERDRIEREIFAAQAEGRITQR